MSICYTTIIMCFCYLNTFLLSDTTKCSRLISYIPCPSPRIILFTKEPWFFLWTTLLESMIWVLSGGVYFRHLILEADPEGLWPGGIEPPQLMQFLYLNNLISMPILDLLEKLKTQYLGRISTPSRNLQQVYATHLF